MTPVTFPAQPWTTQQAQTSKLRRQEKKKKTNRNRNKKKTTATSAQPPTPTTGDNPASPNRRGPPTTLRHVMLRMWDYLLRIAGPIAGAAISLFSAATAGRDHDRTAAAVEWVEYNHADAHPGRLGGHEPLPDYDDPFLRPDHPYWGGSPPAGVAAGEHGPWDPPRLRDLPPVSRVPRRNKGGLG